MLEIKATTGKAELKIKGIRDDISDLEPVFRNFQTYMQSTVTRQFQVIRQGGKDRGVSWDWFAPQYTRADGTVVPAEGGIPKIRGGGLVLGRKRGESNKRVDESSSLMDNNSTLRAELLSKQSFSGDKFTMDTPSDYASVMHALRPFQFFEEPKDVNELRTMIVKRIGEN